MYAQNGMQSKSHKYYAMSRPGGVYHVLLADA